MGTVASQPRSTVRPAVVAFGVATLVAGAVVVTAVSRDPTSTPGCRLPAASGPVVALTLLDMVGRRMAGGRMGGAAVVPGMLRVLPARSSVPAGRITLQVTNAGSRTHELVVLPLPDGQPVGARPVGPDGRVSEAGSLGEVSRSCGTGAGDGLRSGTAGATTLTLAPGRYELVCNLPDHYAAGMVAELAVT